jgi:hypothetical protein
MKLAWIVIATAAVLAGCGSKTGANAKNFGTAIERHLQEEGHLCLGTDRWPVDLPANEVAANTRGAAWPPGVRMRALQNAGLLTASEIEVDEGASIGKTTGRMRKVVRYTLTDSAKPYTREAERVRSSRGADKPIEMLDLCWGRKAIDKVVKWEGPMEFGEFKTARVIYTYRIVDMADWAKSSEMQEVFRTIESELEQAGREAVKAVKLTSEGWEVKRAPF